MFLAVLHDPPQVIWQGALHLKERRVGEEQEGFPVFELRLDHRDCLVGRPPQIGIPVCELFLLLTHARVLALLGHWHLNHVLNDGVGGVVVLLFLLFLQNGTVLGFQNSLFHRPRTFSQFLARARA